MNFIDICAGIGGFRSGLEQAGHKCIGYVEIDKYARKSYEAMYDTNEEWTAEDITKIQSEEIPQADLWCFGFPCQDISVAGRQKGLQGERSGIFYSIINLLKSKDTEDRPEWILVENVKNLLSLHGGREFTEVLYQISEAGYDAQWYLINSKDHGVPQNRERVFIIGHLRERGGFKILSETGTNRQTGCKRQTQQQTCEGKSKPERQEKFGDRFQHMIGNRKYQNSHVYGTGGVSRACDTSGEIYYAIPKQIISGDQAHRVYDSNGLSVTIKAEGGGVGAKTGLYTVPKIKTIATGDNQRKSVQLNNGIARALTATDYKEPQSIAVPCLTPDRLNKRQNGRRFKDNEDPMFTLTAQDRHGVLIYNGKEYYIRRLTPKECFRLQGFTDEQFSKAEEVNSNTQLYKQAGNAVTVNVAYQIGIRLSA